MSAYVISKRIIIDADPLKVWDALTNPEKTRRYFFHCRVFSDWQPGSPIVFKGRLFLFKKIELIGRILQVIPGKLLQYTLYNEGNNRSFSTITDQLHYENGATTLSITDDVGPGPGAEERYKRSEKGWHKVLRGLKKLMELEK